jgi:signal transduction histidine kinase/CheY-like chemotaxis protein
MPTRGRLFRKYAAYFAGVVALGVLTSGLVGLAFSYRDTRQLVDELHLEKARVAATRIEQYLRTIESHLRAALLAHAVARGDTAIDEQHQELIKLLRIDSAVIEAAWIDAGGTERLRLSRIAPDVLRGTRDRSVDPLIVAAAAGKTTFGPVYFRQQTEPYVSVAVAGDEPQAGIVVAEINLKFVWDVVSTMHVGKSGYAYVVDGRGRLISHPDISLVLRQTDLSALPQVRASMSGPERGDPVSISGTAADGKARPSLSAWIPVPAPGWFVYVEQPVTEAFAPLYASIARTALVLIASLAFCIALSVALARHMTKPIRALQMGAARIGEGKLDERVSITTGDELETLAHEFNTMAQRLHESRSGLEQKIDDRTRALAEANNAKSRFLAVASHDLRQPVHALGLYVAQAKEARGDARESLIGRIESSWQSISGLLDALLDISKLDSNTLQVNGTNFAAQSVLDRIEQSFAVAAAARGLRMRVRPSPLLLASDALLIERILLNLVSNALRYTREGGVLIGVRRNYPGSHARIDVWDTGAGIAPEESRQIFDEFYRGRAGSVESAGMGLGLAIVRRIAQLLEVEVTVRSTPGKGSLFSITVPLAPAGSTVDLPAPRERPESRFAGGLALIIDDDADARDAASGLLRQWGWDVISAGSSRDALAALASDSRTPDVIVSDYHLADETGHESGIDAIARIRAARAREIPAVVVSGDVTAELRAHAARESLHLLHKPLQAAKLRAMLHHLYSAETVR